MRATKLHQLAMAIGLGLTMTLALAVMMMFAGGTSLVFAEDQPDGSTIISPQTTSGTWGPGTITATEDVIINPGVVITIASNTTILVADGVGFTVNGDLHTDGPVTFTGITATPGSWEGVLYADGSTGYLNQVTIEYAQHALTLDTLNPITVVDSHLRYNLHQTSGSTLAYGAGLHIIQGDHLIQNTQVYSNVADATGTGQVRGGGIYVEAGSPRILNSWIYENAARGNNFGAGGGIAISGGGALIESSYILTNTLTGGGNRIEKHGGGVGFVGDTTSVISDTWIAANRNTLIDGYATGGGISFASGASASLIESNVVYDNYVSGVDWCEGGGIDTWGNNSGTIRNNLVLSNTLTGPCTDHGAYSPIGGGMTVNQGGGGLYVLNNTFVGNQAVDNGGTRGRGGGLYVQGGSPVVNNNIVVNNAAGLRGGGVYRDVGTVDYNDIFGNTAPTNPDVQGAVGSNNIYQDPLFLGTGDIVLGHHIQHGSPAIDAATDTGTGIPDDDYDDQTRPLGDHRDIGFDEVDPVTYAKSVDLEQASGGFELTYTVVVTNPDPYATLVGGQVTDVLPTNTTYSSGPNCNLGSCDYDVGANTITWTGDIPAASVLTLDYTVVVDLGLTDGTQITNQAEVTVGAVSDSTNSVMTTIYNPDLALTKGAAPEPVQAGETLNYSIAIANNGLGAATGVTVSDPLPADTQFVAGSIALDPPGAGTAGTAPPTLATDVRVNAGQSVTITYAVTVDEPLDAGTTIQNEASVTSVQDPTTPVTGSVGSTVSTTPLVDVVKSGPGTASIDDTLVFTFTVTNVGNTLLHNVEVEDDLAGTATYVGGDDGDGWLDLTEAWVYTGSYTIQENDPSPLTNTVTVTATDTFSTETIDTDTHSCTIGPENVSFLPIIFKGY